MSPSARERIPFSFTLNSYPGGFPLLSVTDGLSNTIMYGERYNFEPYFVKFTTSGNVTIHDDFKSTAEWYNGSSGGHVAYPGYPINYRLPSSYAAYADHSLSNTTAPYKLDYSARRAVYGSGHPGGANVCFGDGSVRMLSDSLGTDILAYLSGRADGIVIPGDY